MVIDRMRKETTDEAGGIMEAIGYDDWRSLFVCWLLNVPATCECISVPALTI